VSGSGPVVLVILDGFGLGDGGPGDATHVAHAPFFERVDRSWPHAKLETSGEAVGLPPGQMGNSEVGHMTMGAGRVIEQELTRIDRAVAAGELDRNQAIQGALRAVQASGGRVHVMGLVSDGGVHSDLDHIDALLRVCGNAGLPPSLHVFLDGRDTPPTSGLRHVRALRPALEASGGSVSSVMGRYWAMDRDNRWDRIGRAYAALVEGRGRSAPDAEAAVQAAYDRGETDEFVEPSVVEGAAPIGDGDAVLFANFRADRARQITNALTDVQPERFAGELERGKIVRLASFVCMTEYDAEFDLPVAFPPSFPEDILGELLATRGLAQLRIAETEKYAHVTFFFNNGIEEPFPGEDRVLIPSPRDVPTYDHKPEMSAAGITSELVQRLESGRYAFVLVNYANPDMVGHTGVLPAAVKAVETIGACLEKLTASVLAVGGQALITADHGNCEQMIDPDGGGPHTAHTTNPVPIWWVTDDPGGRRLHDGTLADLAPTVLELLGLAQPEAMTGRSLLARDAG